MPFKLDFKRVHSTVSDRVKCCDLHPNEPWMLVSLYNGQLQIHNYETKIQIKTFNTSQAPVRAAKFISRKNWVICGSDDLLIRVFNYNTLEKVASFEAHSDYIRCINVHPYNSIILTSSDDMLIKVWDWDKRWECTQTLQGHDHYVMQLAINPKDPNQMASASLDKRVKVWQIGGSSKPSFTLEGHDKGVNAVDYCHSGDKPYLISAADDWYIKVWDYQNKSCVHTLAGHSNNVVSALFHPLLPLIFSISEDGSLRMWNISTFKNENSLNYGMGRMWCISIKKETNEILLGYDDGAILLRLGREFPTLSMDSNGKVMISKQNLLLQTNIKNLEMEFKNGEKIQLPYKELGTCEIYPQTIVHSPNARFVAVLGDGEYIVYTTLALRSKIFGNAEIFVWASDSNTYAVKEANMVRIFKNFKEANKLIINYVIEDLFGGPLLGVKSSNEIHFYEWSDLTPIIRIETNALSVYWNPNFTLCCICTETFFHLLQYDSETVDKALSGDGVIGSGVEGAFLPITDINECVQSGYWIGDCFVFTNKTNRLCYLIGSQTFTLYHIERPHFLLGYTQQNSRLYLSDKEGNIVSYIVDMPIMEYKIAILKKDFNAADQILPSIPVDLHQKLASFLENQGLLFKALELSTDSENKFNLAIKLNNFEIAKSIAIEINDNIKWKLLGKLALSNCQYTLAIECFRKVKDISSLLLLSVCLNNKELLEETLKLSIDENSHNISFLIYYITGRINDAIDILEKSNMYAEATFMAHTYSSLDILQNSFKKWKENVSKTNLKHAELLANPVDYPNLFPELSKLTSDMTNLKI